MKESSRKRNAAIVRPGLVDDGLQSQFTPSSSSATKWKNHGGREKKNLTDKACDYDGADASKDLASTPVSVRRSIRMVNNEPLLDSKKAAAVVQESPEKKDVDYAVDEALTDNESLQYTPVSVRTDGATRDKKMPHRVCSVSESSNTAAARMKGVVLPYWAPLSPGEPVAYDDRKRMVPRDASSITMSNNRFHSNVDDAFHADLVDLDDLAESGVSSPRPEDEEASAKSVLASDNERSSHEYNQKREDEYPRSSRYDDELKVAAGVAGRDDNEKSFPCHKHKSTRNSTIMSDYSATRGDGNHEQQQLRQQHQLKKTSDSTECEEQSDGGVQPAPEQQGQRPIAARDSMQIGAVPIRGPEASIIHMNDGATTIDAPNHEEQLCVAAEVAPNEGDLEATIDSRIAAQLNRMAVNATNVASMEEEGDGDNSGGERRVCSSKRVGIILGVLLLLVVGVIVAVVVPLTGGSRSERTEPATNTDATLPPALPPTGPTGGTTCDFDILEETDLHDNAISTDIPLSVPFDDAVEECKTICSILPTCAAFVLVDAGAHPNSLVNDVVPLCWIKESVPPESDQQGITSGIKNAGSGVCSFPETTYNELPSTDLEGFDLLCISMGFVSTLDEATSVCQDICSAMSNCKAFTAADPRSSLLLLNYSCCIKNGVPDHLVGAEPLTNSGIKL